MISQIRAAAYGNGWLKTYRLPSFVVSVGNISMGGTGKSPMVMELAAMALKAGLSVGVLSRGYKRKSHALVVSPPMSLLPSAEEIGDEPRMIKSRLPGISLLVHSDRMKKAFRHWKEFGAPKLVLLDDGFQHWRAFRDRDLVMLDATESIEQRAIPFGRLRESLAAIRRADIVVINRADAISPEALEALRAKIAYHLQKSWKASWQAARAHPAEVLSCSYALDSFWDTKEKKAVTLPDRPLLLLTGIAKPDGVRELLRPLNLNIPEEMHFPDHHRVTDQQKKQVEELVRSQKYALLVTEKDWARWESWLRLFDCYVMRIKIHWQGDSEKKFLSFFEDIKACSISR